MEKMLASVNTFIDELQKQIALFENLEPKSDYFESDYNLLKDMLNNRGFNIKNMTIGNVANLTNDELELILSKIGLDRREIIHYLYNFPIEKEKHEQKDYSSNKYFNELIKKIEDFVLNYEELSDNRSGLKSSKLELYKKYVELFSEDFFEVFEDMDELKKVMSSLAIPLKDQWQIIKYVTGKNINIAETKEKDINLVKEVTEFVNTYLDIEDEDMIAIDSHVSKKELDVELLPTTARNISETLNIPMNKCLGILSSLILNSLLLEYEELLNSDIVDINRISELRDLMKTILKNKINVYGDIINDAMDIVSNNCEYILDNKEIDIKPLVQETISEIQSGDIPYEDAVKLKTIPIVRSISDTLDNLSKLDISLEDYKLCCELLEDLIEAYNNIVAKQEIKRVI